MPEVTPFRAVRYSDAAGPLSDLVAPPYDVVDDDERATLYTRSPFNVAHMTLPESAGEAARLYRQWLGDGILEREDEDSMWVVVEHYAGPDGVERQRRGLIVSLAAEPYEAGHVLPHERTRRGVLDDRLALLRATGVQLEPILLLADAPLSVEEPDRLPDLAVDGTRLWRAPERRSFDVGQLLVADGHHRYESAVELGAELGRPVRTMALVVSTDDPGLHVFPTHRVFVNRPDVARGPDDEPCPSLEEALARLENEPSERAVAIRCRRGEVGIVHGDEGQLDVGLVDRYGLDGIRYTHRLDDALAAVDDGVADAAFILRPPRIEDVFEAARNGVRMPPKSTYFFPKPVSGLLFHPVTA